MFHWTEAARLFSRGVATSPSLRSAIRARPQKLRKTPVKIRIFPAQTKLYLGTIKTWIKKVVSKKRKQNRVERVENHAFDFW
jgi:hypothetical protein